MEISGVGMYFRHRHHFHAPFPVSRYLAVIRLVPRLGWRFNWRDTITETLVCPDGEQFKEPTMCIKHARMWKKLNVLKDVDQRGDLVQ